MRTAAPILATVLGLASVSLARPSIRQSADDDRKTFIQQMQSKYEEATNKLLDQGSSCTKDNVKIRRSWDALSRDDKIEYLNAVKCLSNIPSVLDSSDVPGAHSYSDDMTYAHINQTNYIHASGLFLPWHRQFIWKYEETLRNECGYTGFLPYWDWSKYADDQASNPMFGPGLDAFGGNGLPVPEHASNDTLPGVPGPVYITKPAGTGGGCVVDGAFANWTVTLGPVAPANNGPDNVWGLKNNPRCLKRDFLQSESTDYMNYDITASIMELGDIDSYSPMLGNTSHPSGHRFGGKDLYDFYTSPNDPVFYLLHGQIDRLWTLWQGQDYDTRGEALNGTVTFRNLPPSEDATLDTIMHMGAVAGGDMPIKDSMYAIGGQYCYMYEEAA